MPRKTDSHNPEDWLYIAGRDLEGITVLSRQEIGYELCRSKLAEVIEKIMKAELLRLGWSLVKTHDLQYLSHELRDKGSILFPKIELLAQTYAEIYFVARYPGFDLEDPDWPALRADVAAVEQLLQKIR